MTMGAILKKQSALTAAYGTCLAGGAIKKAEGLFRMGLEDLTACKPQPKNYI